MDEPEPDQSIPGSATTSGGGGGGGGGTASLLGRHATDARALLDQLALTFASTLPAATVVQRKGLFNRGRAISIRIHLGDTVFELAEQFGRVDARKGSSVGGVALGLETLPIGSWITSFAAALDNEAAASQDVRAALSRLASTP